MGSNGAVQFPMSEQIDGSEPAIEIKIKTLDSQTYTLKVDKQMPVPALKEQIASVTGVLSEQQRLICRGKVLKDDQLLSAYHVEDGHTLHLVVREPIPLSSEGQPNPPGTDPASGTSHGQSSVVFESFSVADGVTPDINQMLSAVFSSIGIGIPNNPSGREGVDATAHRHFTLGTYGGMFDPSQILSEQAGTRTPSDRSNDPLDNSAAFSFGNMPPPVIPDSLNTLTQYLGHLRRDFDLVIARDGGRSQTASSHTNEESSSFSLGSGIRPEGLLPSPASLAEVMRTARQLLIEQAGESLLQLASQLDQVGVTDSSARMRTQTIALRTGALFHNLGACLLELGRTMMTLQMGRTPFDAVVNAGPAVFISPTGPNPIMVQPLPFQSGMSLGAIPMGAPGSGFVPRRIEIQIRRGSPTALNVNGEEHGNLQQPSQRSPAPRPGGENSTNQATARVSGSSAFTGDSAVRILPFRTMVPSRLPSDSSPSSIGLIYPVLGRSQHVASSNLNGEQGTQASGDRRPASGNLGDTAREGSTASIRHPDQSNGRSFSFIVSSGGTQNDQESERQVPSSVLNAVRALFPGGEIHVVNGSAQGTTSSSVSDQTRMSSGVTVAPEAEPRVSEEGLFLSNLLHQVMPLISQSETREPGPVHAEVENSSEQRMAQDTSSLGESSNIGSRRQRDCDNNPPNSKRQKRE